MSFKQGSDIFSILQPDLLPMKELADIIESRCCRASNLRSLSKEALVCLFRRLIMPLPQRLYRANRRGKMLMARRAKAGLYSDIGGRKEKRSSCPNSRLKPPPDSSRRNGETGRLEVSHKDAAKDGNGGTLRLESRKVTLKRPSSGIEKPTNEMQSPTESKKQRTAIKWP